MLRESFNDGKYTVLLENGEFRALRYGEEWRDLSGDGLIMSMLFEVYRLRKIVTEVHSWVVCAPIAPPEDMALNFPRIIEITSPNFDI